MNVYYSGWRTWYKAVCGGKGESEGHVLRDTTSRGLRGLLCMFITVGLKKLCHSSERVFGLWSLEGALSPLSR